MTLELLGRRNSQKKGKGPWRAAARRAGPAGSPPRAAARRCPGSTFSLLVSMQLKQAALAANDYEADIFATEAWKNFATTGVKAWYAHTRGWLCSKVEDITLIHYEKVLDDFDNGK